MALEANQKALVAVDLGAQSCRVSLLRRQHGDPEIELVHRFPNGPRQTSNGLCWDAEKIFEGIAGGLRACAEAATEGIASIGIDGWAVDYVHLLPSGEAACEPFCYRDVRTEEAERQVHELVPPAQVYAQTGIQILRLNTLYQLYADKLAAKHADLPWLNLPEFMSYRLSGAPVAEYTNATHTALVELGAHEWCRPIFERTGLSLEAAPPIVPSGTVIGELQGELRELSEFREAKIIVPACHDTASAIAAIPARGDDWAFVSSGTWSLVGTVLDSPCVTNDAYQSNFTNLGGVGGKTYFLKNVNGMWLLQQCMEQWEHMGQRWSLNELIHACASLEPPDCLVDVDEPSLMVPGDTVKKLNRQLGQRGATQLAGNGVGIAKTANLIFHSLAARYAQVLSSISDVTGKKLRRLFIVGGGNQNDLLNRLTAKRTGLEVICGAVESTTIGNFAVQMAALDGSWSKDVGVSAAAVTEWAEKLGRSRVSLHGVDAGCGRAAPLT
jgi:rhamnulokinase